MKFGKVKEEDLYPGAGLVVNVDFANFDKREELITITSITDNHVMAKIVYPGSGTMLVALVDGMLDNACIEWSQVDHWKAIACTKLQVQRDKIQTQLDAVIDA